MSKLVQVATLIWAGKVDAAMALHERYARFTQRCIAAGMPSGWYGHECSGKVVCAGNIANATQHAVYVDGKLLGKVQPNKAAALDVYFANRDATQGGRTNAEYVKHNALCTDAKASTRFTRMSGRGIKHKARIINAQGAGNVPAKVAKGNAKGKGKGKASK